MKPPLEVSYDRVTETVLIDGFQMSREFIEDIAPSPAGHYFRIKEIKITEAGREDSSIRETYSAQSNQRQMMCQANQLIRETDLRFRGRLCHQAQALQCGRPRSDLNRRLATLLGYAVGPLRHGASSG